MMHALRIQRSRGSGWRKPAGAVCVTRPGRWGNPFYSADSFVNWLQAGKVGTDLVKPLTPEELATRRQWILDHVAELRGTQLACWCEPEMHCHADVLATLANP